MTSNIKFSTIATVFTFVISLLIVGGFFYDDKQTNDMPKASTNCWVWLSTTDISNLNECNSLLLYQGDIFVQNGQSIFIKRGLSPYDIGPSKDIGAVLRLNSLVDVKFIEFQIRYLVKQWAQRKVRIQKIQIDFDSPSSKLLDYTDFLKQLQSNLDHISISITGLSSWLYDNPTDLNELAMSVDYIAMQLYQVHEPHDNYQQIAEQLSKSTFQYRLGITPSPQFKINELKTGENFVGFSIFINQ